MLCSVDHCSRLFLLVAMIRSLASELHWRATNHVNNVCCKSYCTKLSVFMGLALSIALRLYNNNNNNNKI